MSNSLTRVRWAAVGAAIAVSIGAGGLRLANATIESGERPVFVPINPCRLFDTRPAPNTVGPRTSPLGANDVYQVQVLGTNGNCTIPADATGVMMTLFGINQTTTTFLTAWPTGGTQPTASSLNIGATAVTAESGLASIDIGAGGQISIFNKNGSINVIGDVVGYFADHNHDDRYYTEAEVNALIVNHSHDNIYYRKADVDAKVANADLKFYGAVASGGGVYSGSGNFTISRTAVGKYCIVLPTTAHSYSAVVTINDVASGGLVALGTLNGSHCNGFFNATTEVVPVYIENSAGTAIDANFNFFVPAD